MIKVLRIALSTATAAYVLNINPILAQEVIVGPDHGNPWDEPINLLPPTSQRLWMIERTLNTLTEGGVVEYCFLDIKKCAYAKVTSRGAPVKVGIDKTPASEDGFFVESIPSPELNRLRRTGQLPTFNTTLAELNAQMEETEKEIVDQQTAINDMSTDYWMNAGACFTGFAWCGYKTLFTGGLAAFTELCSLAVWPCGQSVSLYFRLIREEKKLRDMIREKFEREKPTLPTDLGEPPGSDPEANPIIWITDPGIITAPCREQVNCRFNQDGIYHCTIKRDC